MGNSKAKWISTTMEEKWAEKRIEVNSSNEANLELSGGQYQKVKGFGGCFNELGWIALSYLSEEDRNEVFKELFDPDEGCKFNFCRMPIGANDYGAEWYSLNETDGDYEMEHFSIERDRSFLIPYIKEAMKKRPDLTLFASPWSPPTWMKFPKVYNYGTLRWEKKVLDAYALYFKKVVEAYKGEGIEIEQIHIQNEPCADQKFPSCLWTGAQMRDFIRDHIGPLFKENNMDIEIWLGTLNCSSYNDFANTALSDPEARQYITGVGYQWAGKEAIRKTYESWPEMRLMQTENECGDGSNSWGYAHYVFDLFRHYFMNGAESYIYWNMALLPEGMSTWGWKQNSMITIEPQSKKAIYNPEFFVMKHFSHFVAPGAVRVGLKGHLTGNAIAFENPDGQVVVITANPFNEKRSFVFEGKGQKVACELEPLSFNTIVVEA